MSCLSMDTKSTWNWWKTFFPCLLHIGEDLKKCNKCATNVQQLQRKCNKMPQMCNRDWCTSVAVYRMWCISVELSEDTSTAQVRTSLILFVSNCQDNESTWICGKHSSPAANGKSNYDSLKWLHSLMLEVVVLVMTNCLIV